MCARVRAFLVLCVRVFLILCARACESALVCISVLMDGWVWGWMDVCVNIKEWTGLEWNIIQRKAKNREEWMKLVVKSAVGANGQLDYGIDEKFDSFCLFACLFVVVIVVVVCGSACQWHAKRISWSDLLRQAYIRNATLRQKLRIKLLSHLVMHHRRQANQP